jgi:hypothetical protein
VPPDLDRSFGELDTAHKQYRIGILPAATEAKDGRDSVKHLWHSKKGPKKRGKWAKINPKLDRTG